MIIGVRNMEEEITYGTLEQVEKEAEAMSTGTYFDPPKGQHNVEVVIFQERMAMRTSKYDKRQALVKVGALDGKKFDEALEWWITITSPTFVKVVEACKKNKYAPTTIKVLRAGDGQSKTVEVLD
jgi:hypothetical protein